MAASGLRWEHVRDGAVHVPFGKTENARRTIPVTQRAAALIEMRRAAGPFPFYTLQHTCLTGWALAYLAGHSDFSTTRRYVHPAGACTVLGTIPKR
jgi:integrase